MEATAGRLAPAEVETGEGNSNDTSGAGSNDCGLGSVIVAAFLLLP